MIKYRGFTLVEILVSMAVILIISGGYAALTRFNKAQELSSAYENLKNTLNEAKSSALSQVIVNCRRSETLVGYQVNFNTISNPNTYSLEEVCRQGGSTRRIEVKKNPLPPGVTLVPPSSAILFLVLSGKVQNAETISLNNGSATKIINVTTSGVVEN